MTLQHNTAASFSHMPVLGSHHIPWKAVIIGLGALLAGMTLSVAQARRQSIGVPDTTNSQLPSSTQTQLEQTTSIQEQAATMPLSVSQDTASSQSQSSMQLTVNGQTIPVPTNGSTQQVITSPDGSATVNVSASNNSQGSSFNSSVTSTNFNVNSSASNITNTTELNSASP